MCGCGSSRGDRSSCRGEGCTAPPSGLLPLSFLIRFAFVSSCGSPGLGLRAHVLFLFVFAFFRPSGPGLRALSLSRVRWPPGPSSCIRRPNAAVACPLLASSPCPGCRPIRGAPGPRPGPPRDRPAPRWRGFARLRRGCPSQAGGRRVWPRPPPVPARAARPACLAGSSVASPRPAVGPCALPPARVTGRQSIGWSATLWSRPLPGWPAPPVCPPLSFSRPSLPGYTAVPRMHRISLWAV